MTTQVASGFGGGALRGADPRSTASELVALHTHLVLRFRSMVTQHLPRCAVVEPWPSALDVTPQEILVIPFRCGAALFSLGFQAGDCIKMKVRIGEHGVLEYAQDEQATESLAGLAGRLFDIALCGRYREELWINAVTGAYVGGQSYFNDDSGQWQELGLRKQPHALPELVRRRVRVQDRRYAAY